MSWSESEIRNFIDWYMSQESPVAGKTNADVFAHQGVSDPYTEPRVRELAIQQLEIDKARFTTNPAHVSPWHEGWRAELEKELAERRARDSAARPDGTVFGGVQDQKHDAPNPNDPPYVDPNQWWYDMTPAQQQAYSEKKVAKLREIAAVVGVSAVPSNTNWITPVNPDGINPAILDEYNRIISQKGYSAKPVETLQSDLEYHKAEVTKIETALSGFAGVQG